MKKKIIAVLFALVLCISAAVPAFAASSHIFDEGGHLTTEEIAELDSIAERIENLYGYCVMFSIAEDVDGSTYEYSEMLYNSEADSENGILVVDNLGGNKYSIYLSGDAENVFTEEHEEIIWNAYNSNETYYGGIASYYAAVETIVENAVSGAPVTDNAASAEPATDAAQGEPVTEFVPVERTLPLVVDYADLLSTEDENALIARLETISQEYEMEVAVVTVTDLEGKTREEFADDFYDYNGYGYGENDDGVLLLYKPGPEGQRDIHITTCGRGINKFSDADIDNILDEVIDLLIDEDYVGAFNKYADMAEDVLKPWVGLGELAICLMIGFAVGFSVIGAIASKNKSVMLQADARIYTRPGSMVVTNGYEQFVNRSVSRTPIPRDDDSSSSTHTSSSGRDHGGGGRSF